MATATGRETKTSTSASTVPRTATSSSRLREDEQAQRDEHRHLPHPGQALVEGGHGLLGGDADRAQRQPGQVDGQEARAVQGVGAAEGQGGHGERRHRVEAGGGEGHAPQRPHRRHPHHHADGQADADLAHEEHGHVRQPVVVVLQPLDEAEHEQHGDRVVEPRFALQGGGQAALERRAAQQREDRRAVGGRQDRAQQHPVERREVEEPCRRQPGDDRGDDRAHDGQRQRRGQDRADLEQARGEPALEEDQGERDDPDPARQLVVVELDEAQAVGADGHAQEDEQQQARHAQAPRDEGREHAGGQQRAGDQDQFPVRQTGSMSVPEARTVLIATIAGDAVVGRARRPAPRRGRLPSRRRAGRGHRACSTARRAR